MLKGVILSSSFRRWTCKPIRHFSAEKMYHSGMMPYAKLLVNGASHFSGHQIYKVPIEKDDLLYTNARTEAPGISSNAFISERS